MRSTSRLLAVLATAGVLGTVPEARGSFVGDLVFCDNNRNGVWEPAGGEAALNGVGVGMECRNSGGNVCFAGSTTTGTLHASAAGLTDLFNNLCAPSRTWDANADLTGRYLFEVFNSCAPDAGPWRCTVTVDQASAPANCNVLTTPLAAGPPADGNGDGDRCDAGDGPFPEGQPLGNLPQAFGTGVVTCNEAPDPAPGNGVFTVVLSPVGGDDCSLGNDFGFAPPPVRLEGCTPGYWKQSQHFDSWVGYLPSNSFEAIFGRNVPGTPTLLNALQLGGGGLNALMRHATAALLNSTSITYAYSASEVIALFQAAFDSGDYETTKDLLDGLNNTGCPLN